MRWRSLILSLLVVLAVGLSGCTTDTDDEEDDPGDVGEGPFPSPSPTNETNETGPGGGTGTSADDPASGTFTVSMEEFAFVPQQVWVEPGTTVRFVNDGMIVHTATADDDSWDTGDVLPGEDAEVTLDAVGEHAYHCAYHEVQGMTGTVHVVAA